MQKQRKKWQCADKGVARGEGVARGGGCIRALQALKILSSSPLISFNPFNLLFVTFLTEEHILGAS